ncbi:transcription activator of gluconeogenesis [Acrasis kona]|uniref:Transcription activator of gluconeogenesis n=1 Tax=Acrasis kona TaxID=1008807 RepID=A0AAW2YX46_9EUKA
MTEASEQCSTQKMNDSCSECRKSHKACDRGRPCSRCVSLNIQDKCSSSYRKKRKQCKKKWFNLSVTDCDGHLKIMTKEDSYEGGLLVTMTKDAPEKLTPLAVPNSPLSPMQSPTYTPMFSPAQSPNYNNNYILQTQFQSPCQPVNTYQGVLYDNGPKLPSFSDIFIPPPFVHVENPIPRSPVSIAKHRKKSFSDLCNINWDSVLEKNFPEN